MVRRETSAELISRIATHPSVVGGIPDLAGVDWAEAFPMTRGAVVLSNGEDAAMVFQQTANERTWQVCTMFQDTCRGQRAREVGAEMREWMRPHADLIFGQVPNRLPGAKKFYEDLGGVPVRPLDVDGESVQAIKIGEDWFLAEKNHELYAMRLN